jgi:hypothetical protein
MCRINLAELKFEHVVVFNREDTVYATARENGSGKTRLFLIFNKGQESCHAYARNGLVQSWELLPEYDGVCIRNNIQRAINNGITVYQFNGSSESVTGQNNPVDTNNN